MKSVHHAGNINMNGKKTKRLSCHCCEAVNFKEPYFDKLRIKDMKEQDFGYIGDGEMTYQPR